MAYRPNSRAIATIAATVLTAVIAGHCAAQSAPISEEAITPNPSFKFQRDDDNNWEAAKDLSGVACLGELGDLVRQCIFVNDSGRFVVPADFDISSLTLAVKGRAEIVNNDAEEQGPTFGSTIDPASVECGQLEDFGGFDGEAVTIAPDADGRDIVYIVGSHGCDRNNPTYKESTFLVATLAPFIKVPLSFRLSEALRTTAGLSEHFGKRLQDNGISIEGVAAVGDRLLFGFRTPLIGAEPPVDANKTIHGDAVILSVRRDALITADQSLEPDTIPVPLGDLGIRDMIALDDSQLLILAGPPGEGDVYRLVLFDLSSRSVVPVADFTGTPTSKPEAIALVGRSAGETGETLQLILLRDGEDAIDGAPTLVTVRLPAN